MRLFGSSKLPAFIDRQTKAVARVFNYYWDHFDARLHTLEETRASWEEATANVSRLALDRINEILGPAIASVAEMQERGFLIAHSSNANTLGQTDVLTFLVEDDAERRLFSPSPFLALTREATPDDYGVASRVSWDAGTGTLVCEVVAAFGDPGPHDDWVIAALAGSTLAQVEMLEQSIAARDRAQDWADKAEDSAVETGKYSARHHALKAAASAATANTQAGIATGSATDATSARDKAQDWADKAEDSAVEAGKYSAKHHAAKAAASALAAATFDPANYYDKTAADGRYAQGPASAADGNLAIYDGTTGKLLKDASLPAAKVVLSDVSTTLTAGYIATADDDGAKSGGTYKPAPSEGNLKRITNGGAFTFAAPDESGDYSLVVQVTNVSGAGTITLSGFTRVTGQAFTTTNGHKFMVYITRINGLSHVNVVALQ